MGLAATAAAGVAIAATGTVADAGSEAETTAWSDAGGAAAGGMITDGVATAIATAVAAAAEAALPLGGHAASAALRCLPIGAVALPMRTAARSSSLGYRPISQ